MMILLLIALILIVMCSTIILSLSDKVERLEEENERMYRSLKK